MGHIGYGIDPYQKPDHRRQHGKKPADPIHPEFNGNGVSQLPERKPASRRHRGKGAQCSRRQRSHDQAQHRFPAASEPFHRQKQDSCRNRNENRKQQYHVLIHLLVHKVSATQNIRKLTHKFLYTPQS